MARTFDGLIDDARLTSIVLSPARIDAEHRSDTNQLVTFEPAEVLP